MYFLAKYKIAEYNYNIYDKELLTVVKALKEWRPELKGVRQPVEIFLDYRNL